MIQKETLKNRVMCLVHCATLTVVVKMFTDTHCDITDNKQDENLKTHITANLVGQQATNLKITHTQ